MTIKRCLLINQVFTGNVGSPLVVYGHTFIIQKDGSAIAKIDDAFIKAETALGRYKVIEDEPDQQKPIPRKDLLKDFGFEIKNFFGIDNPNKLYKMIKKLDKDQMILFAETRLKLNLPEHMSQTKMIDEISKIIKIQTDKPESNKTLDDLDKLEAKLKKDKGE